VPDWFVILIAAAALLLAMWCVGEWICRRISARYAKRNRRWRGLGPDDGPDGDSASE
jgi:hypothetical protein